MTVRADPFANQPDFWVDAVINSGNGSVTSQTGHGAKLTLNASPGVFDVTLDGGGLAADAHVCDVEYDAAAGLFVRVADIDENVKRITFTSSADALTNPTKIRYVGWYCK